MTPEYVIGTILVGGIGATFALYQRGMASALAAKDTEIAWLREQLERTNTRLERALQVTRRAVDVADGLPKPK